jgi:3-deoxy-D-manno-octulosonic acid (KDO) 8-phosphate synthase
METPVAVVTAELLPQVMVAPRRATLLLRARTALPAMEKVVGTTIAVADTEKVQFVDPRVIEIVVPETETEQSPAVTAAERGVV